MGMRTRLGLVRCGLVMLLLATSLATSLEMQPSVQADSLDPLLQDALVRVGVSLMLREKAVDEGTARIAGYARVASLLYAMGNCLESGKRGVAYLACIRPQQQALDLSDQDLNGAFQLTGTWSFGESFTHTFGKMTVGTPGIGLDSNGNADTSNGELMAANGGTAFFTFVESGIGFDFQYSNSGGDQGRGWIGWVKGGCVLVGTFQSDKFGKDGIPNNGVIIMRRC